MFAVAKRIRLFLANGDLATAGTTKDKEFGQAVNNHPAGKKLMDSSTTPAWQEKFGHIVHFLRAELFDRHDNIAQTRELQIYNSPRQIMFFDLDKAIFPILLKHDITDHSRKKLQDFRHAEQQQRQ